MARRIQQFRYYGTEHNNNQPSSISYQKLVSGSAFSSFTPITQLGIQGLPGMKFYLNNSHEGIIIGNTGIYELDLQGQAEVSALSFDANSINFIRNNPNAYLIVDIIYEDGKE